MTFQHLDYTKKVFFECFKLIENVKSVDICLCEKYHGCQSIENFQKIKRDTVAPVSFRIDLT